MDIKEMTPAERAALKAQLEAEERAEKQKREDNITAYKDAVDEFCKTAFARLEVLSKQMRAEKDRVFAEAETLIKLKEELYKTKIDRHSDSFTTADSKISVALGTRTNDGWDNTVDIGVAKVKEYLASLAKDDNAAKMYDIVLRLLAKDRKGNLRANAMLQLEQYARKFGDPLFIEGVDIIRSAYQPVDSCQFISVKYKDDNGVQHALPLSLAAME